MESAHSGQGAAGLVDNTVGRLFTVGWGADRAAKNNAPIVLRREAPKSFGGQNGSGGDKKAAFMHRELDASSRIDFRDIGNDQIGYARIDEDGGVVDERGDASG